MSPRIAGFHTTWGMGIPLLRLQTMCHRTSPERDMLCYLCHCWSHPNDVGEKALSDSLKGIPPVLGDVWLARGHSAPLKRAKSPWRPKRDRARLSARASGSSPPRAPSAQFGVRGPPFEKYLGPSPSWGDSPLEEDNWLGSKHGVGGILLY